MPDVPQLREYPYESKIPCKTCSTNQDNTKYMMVHMEQTKGKNTLQHLYCPDCNARRQRLVNAAGVEVSFN